MILVRLSKKIILYTFAAILLFSAGFFGCMLYFSLSDSDSTDSSSISAVTKSATRKADAGTTEPSSDPVTTGTVTATSTSAVITSDEVHESTTEISVYTKAAEPLTDQHFNELSDFLNRNGFTAEQIGDSGQVITVESSGSSCNVRMFERQSDGWNVVLETYGAVGLNGVSDKSCEGDYCTPRGIYPLGFAFGTQPLDGLKTEYRQIKYNSYWIDDPESPLYNQWVESDQISWRSAEHLSDYSSAYKYSVVIEYNMSPVVPYRGSAIFLHCYTGSYTAGCVSVPESDMLSILQYLDPAKSPVIVIV